MTTITQGIERTERGILYTVSVDGVQKWSRFVAFGRGPRYGSGGTVFKAASREQDKVSESFTKGEGVGDDKGTA